MSQQRVGIVVAVYNRPDELQELLVSLVSQREHSFRVVVVEDGSSLSSSHVCRAFENSLDLTYVEQANTGPALARNKGVEVLGDTCEFVLFVDSDCTLPPQYMLTCYEWLATTTQVDLWGGPDAWNENFSPIQKAISYAMTSPFSTGGIRGGNEVSDKFYPRTFNMGVRLSAFRAVGGFKDLRYGEDVDLSMRLVEAGYHSYLAPRLFVYHKRRTSWRSFFMQVYHSGTARYMLSRLHRGSLKLVHLLPSVGIVVLVLVLFVSLTRWQYLVFGVLAVIYFLLLFVDAQSRFHDIKLALRSVYACAIMILGYGLGLLGALFGFSRSYCRVKS